MGKAMNTPETNKIVADAKAEGLYMPEYAERLRRKCRELEQQRNDALCRICDLQARQNTPSPNTTPMPDFFKKFFH